MKVTGNKRYFGGWDLFVSCPLCGKPSKVIVNGKCSRHRWYRRRLKTPLDDALFYFNRARKFKTHRQENLAKARTALKQVTRLVKGYSNKIR